MELQVIGNHEDEHVRLWKGCVRCVIGEIAHNHVFWRGSTPCDILFIGEGPGVTEDLTGKPFVGRAGKLLTSWIQELPEGVSWAITNVVLCRPCDGVAAPNRAPNGLEIANCRPRLDEFMFQIAKPRALVLLGKTAKVHAPRGPLPTLELLHPAAVNYQGGSGSKVDLSQREKLKGFVHQEIQKWQS
jgi:uracil-DNA glycosylase family 4